MKYIDKSINKQKGEQIVGEFLSCFHNRRETYPKDMYDAFSKEIDDAHGHVIFRQRLISDVLIPEQGNKIGFVSPARRYEAPVSCTAAANVI